MRLTATAWDRVQDAVGEGLNARLSQDSAWPVAVAFSGGGDSLALLLAAYRWALRRDRRLIALTVHHGLSLLADDWSRWCAARAAALGVEHRTLCWLGDKPASGIAAAARSARHRLLADAAREAGASVILMGHTADDVLEAAWMRAEGSSVSLPGAWGPSPAWPDGRGVFLLRPMLGLRRAAIREGLAAIGEGWIDDPANENFVSLRVRARQSIALSSPVLHGGENARDERPLCGDSGFEPQGSASRLLFTSPRGRGREPRPLSWAWEGEGLPGRHGNPSPSHLRWARPSPYGRGVPFEAREEQPDIETLLGAFTVDWAGCITFETRVLSAPARSGDLVLAAALLCAAGTDVPPRGKRLARLRERLTEGERFVATLCGARVESVGGTARIMRDEGVLTDIDLAASEDVPVVFDGRFELCSRHGGANLVALAGRQNRLPKDQRQSLKTLPPAARRGLPAAIDADGKVICPLLSTDWSARCLVRERLEAACGRIDREAALRGVGENRSAILDMSPHRREVCQ